MRWYRDDTELLALVPWGHMPSTDGGDGVRRGRSTVTNHCSANTTLLGANTTVHKHYLHYCMPTLLYTDMTVRPLYYYADTAVSQHHCVLATTV